MYCAGLRTRSIFVSSLNSSLSSACFTSSSSSSSLTFSFLRVQVRVRFLSKFIKFFRVQKICYVVYHIYPPFTRKRIVSLCFGRYVHTRLGVAISEVSGPPVFHTKMGCLVKCLAQGYYKQTCRLVLHNLP